MRNEQWIFYENFSVFGQIENLWMDKITYKSFTSIQPRFLNSRPLRMQECRDESEIYNSQRVSNFAYC